MPSSLDIIRTYVEGQARLGYATFDPGPRPDDVLLATFPKSGSTWCSYLLHALRSGDDAFTDIKDEVIDITPGHWDPRENPFLVPQRFAPRTFKTHGSRERCPRGGRVIYIARDPRDGFLSLYHFIHDLFALPDLVPMDAFFRHYYVDRFGSGHDIGHVWDHLRGWHAHREEPDVLWLHYEDLLEDLPACLRIMARFMGVPDDEARLEAVRRRASMDHMRTIAGRINPSPRNRTGRLTLAFGPGMERYASDMRFGKMRRGVRGDGRRELPPEILAALDEEWRRRIVPALGYPSYEALREACSPLRAAAAGDAA